MKPFGSITNRFPFIEPEERELVLSIVEESCNYSDFAEKLYEYVMSNDTSEEMVFLADSHLLKTMNVKAREKLLSQYSQLSFIRPDFVSYQMSVNGEEHDWQIVMKEVDDAIAKNVNPMILLHLYGLKWTCVLSSSTGTLEEDRIIQRMTDLIEKNPSLEFARGSVSLMLANRYATENNHERGMEEYESALQYALTHDDVVFSTWVQTHMAKFLSLTDPTRALELIESVATKEKELGYLDRCLGTFRIMGVIFDARGEYTAAVKSYAESLAIREKLHEGLSLRLTPTALSRAYRRMGDTEESLEWAKVALSSTPMYSRVQSLGLQVTANLNMSAALALLGKLNEAKSYHDIGNELALKAGIEIWLSDAHLCKGLISRAEGRLTEALESFESTHEIVERLQRQGRINECLYLLAETEIQHYIETPESDGLLALHWIGTMEELARTKDLPGVLGLALLLKARMLFLQGRDEEAQSTLNQVSELSEFSGTIFLQDKIDLVTTASTVRRRR
jgi:tetratricopeptide (TPR) repeat protein